MNEYYYFWWLYFIFLVGFIFGKELFFIGGRIIIYVNTLKVLFTIDYDTFGRSIKNIQKYNKPTIYQSPRCPQIHKIKPISHFGSLLFILQLNFIPCFQNP